MGRCGTAKAASCKLSPLAADNRMARPSVTLRVQVRIIPCPVGLIGIGRVQETMTGTEYRATLSNYTSKPIALVHIFVV